jgi:hypothetical protein
VTLPEITVVYRNGGSTAFYVEAALPDMVDLAFGFNGDGTLGSSDQPITLTSVRWRDPEGPNWDEDADLPVLTRSVLVIRPSAIEAVEEAEPHELAAIARARVVQAQRQGAT